jgi:hypothetical protein
MRSLSKQTMLSGLAAVAIAIVGLAIWVSQPAKSQDKGSNGQTITRLGL